MNANTPLKPAAADQADVDEAIALLSAALADAPVDAAAKTTHGALRARLLRRVSNSAALHQGMVTVRQRHGQAIAPAPGVQVRWIYRAADEGARRPGEPAALAMIHLDPGARLAAGLNLVGRSSEWLVVHGQCTVDGTALEALDLHGRGASPTEPLLASDRGATVYLRDGGHEATPVGTSREREASWEDYAPGIRRRVLWQHGSAMAYLARAQSGALVPSHGHRNDEECLMIEGDLFAGDILVRAGDFQLAPAGVVHGTVQAGSDNLLYVRGDAELAVELGDPTR